MARASHKRPANRPATQRSGTEPQGVLARLGEGIVVLDREWRYTYINDSAAAMFGRIPADLIGKHIWTEFPEGVGQPFHLNYERALETQKDVVFEDYYAPWDRWFENRVYPSEDGLTILFHEVTDRKRVELALRDTVTRLLAVIEGTETGLWDWDLRTNRVKYSREWKSQIGYADDEITDDFEEWRSRVHPDDLGPAEARVKEFLEAPSPHWENQFRFRHRDGSYRWILARGHIIRNVEGQAERLVGIHIDVTEATTQRLQLEGQNRVMALAAANVPVAEVIEVLVKSAEEILDRARVSILLLDDDGVHIRHAAAPSLSTAFVQFLEGLPIGPTAGPCGIAMFRRQRVIVADIATDPLWEGYRHFALSFGLRSCWSTPIIDGRYGLLGSFAVYQSEPGTPSQDELRRIDELARLSAVIISKTREAAALVEGERQLRSIVDNVADEIFLASVEADDRFRIVSINRAALGTLGATEQQVVGKYVHEITPPDMIDGVLHHCSEAIRRRVRVMWHQPYPRSPGRTGIASVSPIFDESGRCVYLVGTVTDVTELLQAGDSLRRSEAQLRRVISDAPVAIAMFDKDLRYLEHSARWLTDYGLPDSSLTGRFHYEVFPGISDGWKDIYRRVLHGESLGAESDQFFRADGTIQWLRWECRPWRDTQGEIGGLIIASEDITARMETDRKLRESHERLRELAAGLERAREAERSRIARELHDELGQSLTGVRMDLAWIRARLPMGDLTVRVDAMAGLIDDTVALGRRIASELRPGMLDDLGLAAALRWQAREFERRFGINVVANVDDEIQVDGERATAAFRVVQEALTNVARHARASRVWLTARVRDDALTLLVMDNGVGIVATRRGDRTTLGLVGMEERVSAWGGQLTVTQRPEGGTELAARIPVVHAEAPSP